MITKEYKGKVLKPGIYYDDEKNKFGYRVKMKDSNGKKVDVLKVEFRTQTEAEQERKIFVYQIKHLPKEEEKIKVYDKTFEEVFEHYLETRAKEKRHSTVIKQKSLWNNHIKPEFGSKKLIDVSKGDMYDYLLNLYHKGDTYNKFGNGYAYAYVEGFIKIFYLIYGYAYDHDWLPSELYTKNFLNKTTKLGMPAMTHEDEEADGKIIVYTKEEIEKIKEIIKDSSIYLAFLFGYHLGLRISECMGLMWSDFDKKAHTLNISKQMQYQDYSFCLVPPKTKAGKRTLYIPEDLYNFLLEYKKQQDKDKEERGSGYKATERVLVRLKATEEELIGGDFIQRKPDGELVTINSVKYWSQKIKKETGINFKFHILRHTCASMLASMNVPKKSLMEFMGHATTAVTEQYYITTNKLAEEKMREALNSF